MNVQEFTDKIYNIEYYNKKYNGFCDSIAEGFNHKEEKEFVEKLNFYSTLKFKDSEPWKYFDEAFGFFQSAKYLNIILENNKGVKFQIGIDGNRLINDIENLESNPKVKFMLKDFLIHLIEVYVDIKVSNKLLMYYFPEDKENLHINANKFYFLFRKILNQGNLISNFSSHEKSCRKFYPNYKPEMLNIPWKNKFCTQFNFTDIDYYGIIINGGLCNLKKIGYEIFPAYYSTIILNKEYQRFESDDELIIMNDSKSALLYPILYTLTSDPNQGKNKPKPEGIDFLSKRNWARQITNCNNKKNETGLKS